MKLSIDPKYATLLPKIPEDNDYRQRLKESMIEEGQRDPITVNQHGIILDRHVRFDICREIGLEAKYTVKHFENELEEHAWVAKANLQRRHPQRLPQSQTRRNTPRNRTPKG